MMGTSDVTRTTTLRCACSRHAGGKVFDRVTDFVAEHQGIDPSGLFDSEVQIMVPGSGPSPVVSPLIFTGVTDEDHRPLEVLVQVYLDDGVAEVSYRRNRFDTWSAPTVTYEEDAEVRAITSSQRRHPSASQS